MELGQTKQKFKRYPERVLYWVDKKCQLPSIDQRSYIPFDRNDIRSIVGSLTLLVRNLKESGLITGKRIKPMETPGIDIPKLAKSLDARLKEICMDLSEVPNGAMENNQFDHHLKNKYSMKDQNINFIKKDLQLNGLVSFNSPRRPWLQSWWVLTNVGWEVVRVELEIKEQWKKQSLGSKIRVLAEREEILKKYKF